MEYYALVQKTLKTEKVASLCGRGAERVLIRFRTGSTLWVCILSRAMASRWSWNPGICTPWVNCCLMPLPRRTGTSRSPCLLAIRRPTMGVGCFARSRATTNSIRSAAMCPLPVPVAGVCYWYAFRGSDRQTGRTEGVNPLLFPFYSAWFGLVKCVRVGGHS